MGDFILGSYAGEDFYEVVDLLAACLTADAVTPALFTRKVLLDPNFDPAGAPVVRARDEITGFLLALARRRPLEDGPDDSERGWITLFGVSPGYRKRGIGTAMLESALEFLRSRGCKTVSVSPYAPNYWAPGVDEAAYFEAIVFLEKHGFRTVSRPISMDTRLVGGWAVPDWIREKESALEEAGVTIDVFDPAHTPALTAFLREEFPGDWQRYARESLVEIVLGRRAADDVIVCYDNGRLIGFSHHEGERFGPFGVAASERGRGIGAVLLFRTLEIMRRKGHHNAWFLWTDDSTADRVYKAAGFRETRRYSVMSREL
jgi:GNAT superfamily N-acetyltransferase